MYWKGFVGAVCDILSLYIISKQYLTSQSNTGVLQITLCLTVVTQAAMFSVVPSLHVNIFYAVQGG